MRALIVAASILGLLLVAAGASGAHSVPIADARQWDNALLYGFVHTLAVIGAALLPFRNRLQLASGWAFVAAVLLFSGQQLGKMLWQGMAGSSETPLNSLGMLVPIGGLLFLAGWLLLGLAALMAQKAD